MRYILNNNYIDEVSFDNNFVCKSKTCVEYNGSVPSGYSSLLEWFENANIQAYYISNGELTYDSVKDAELQQEWVTENASEPITGVITGTNAQLKDKSNNNVYPAIPIAAANTLGGIKVGTNLSIDGNGVLSASGGNSEVVLYNDATGTNGSITLSETSANFSYIEIFFTDNNSVNYSYTKVYNPDGKMVTLSVIENSNNYINFRTSGVSINGASMSVQRKAYATFNASVQTFNTSVNYIYIKRVVGYR